MTPKFALQDRCIVIDGAKTLRIDIIHDEDNKRAIEPAEADELMRGMVALLNMASSLPEPPPLAEESTYRVYFREDETVTSRGYIQLCAKDAAEAVRGARSVYAKAPDSLHYNDNSHDSEAEIFCVDRWDPGVDPDRSLCPDMTWDDLNLGVAVTDPINGVL
jgi:hypothetical protein